MANVPLSLRVPWWWVVVTCVRLGALSTLGQNQNQLLRAGRGSSDPKSWVGRQEGGKVCGGGGGGGGTVDRRTERSRVALFGSVFAVARPAVRVFDGLRILSTNLSTASAVASVRTTLPRDDPRCDTTGRTARLLSGRRGSVPVFELELWPFVVPPSSLWPPGLTPLPAVSPAMHRALHRPQTTQFIPNPAGG